MCSIMGYCNKDGDWPALQEALKRTVSRGPDDTRTVDTGNGWIGFNRLSIMGTTDEGMQPFVYRNRTTCLASELSETEMGMDMPKKLPLLQE